MGKNGDALCKRFTRLRLCAHFHENANAVRYFLVDILNPMVHRSITTRSVLRRLKSTPICASEEATTSERGGAASYPVSLHFSIFLCEFGRALYAFFGVIASRRTQISAARPGNLLSLYRCR